MPPSTMVHVATPAAAATTPSTGDIQDVREAPEARRAAGCRRSPDGSGGLSRAGELRSADPDAGYSTRRTGSPRMPADQVVVSVTPEDQLNLTLIQHAVGIDASQE